MAVAPLNAMGFFDVQNLFRHAKDAFGHIHPNFDPLKLHQAVCRHHCWNPNLVRFYTGVPDFARDPKWSTYWSNRVMALKRSGVHVTTRKLRYSLEEIELPDGEVQIVESCAEKGIDIRIALDIVSLARRRNYDVAVIFSQDQDLAEVVSEIREIGREQGREIKICCAYPAGPHATTKRGIDKTDWFKMDEEFYNACLDPRDYRPKKK